MRTPMDAGSAKPRPPIAALRNPSGARAGTRTSSSGRLDGDSSTITASTGRRSASAANTCPARSASPAAGGAGAGGRSRAALAATPRSGPASGSARQAAGRGARAGEHGEAGRAAVRLGRVLGDDRDPRAGLDERAGHVRVLAEGGGADGEHHVVAAERAPQPRAVGGQVAGEKRGVLREA